MPETHRRVAPGATQMALFVLASLGGTGCLEPLPDVSLVTGLRVLGVQADPPEVAPGGEVNLSALVVEPGGGAFSLSWAVCLVPERGQGFFGGGGLTSTSGGEGTPLDADPDGSSCRAKVAAGRAWAWDLGEGQSKRFTVPPDLLDDPAAVAVAFGLPEDLAVPEAIRAGLLGIAGLNLRVELVVTPDDPTVQEIVATRRINVSLDSPLPDNARNTNPAGFALARPTLNGDTDGATGTGTASPDDGSAGTGAATADDGALPEAGRCFPGPALTLAPGRHALTPTNFPEAPIPYWVILAGSSSDAPFELKQVEESWFHSFFATAGQLEKPISKTPGQPENVWRLGPEDTGPQSLWMVVRDGRGGLAWCSETVTVE
jgi:hypothetical protein